MAIQGYAYEMPVHELRVGESLTWTNQDAAPHDVATTTAPAPFKSPLLDKGESWTHTFTVPGTYEYHCSVHPAMQAKVTAAAAASPPHRPAPEQAERSRSGSDTGQDRKGTAPADRPAKRQQAKAPPKRRSAPDIAQRAAANGSTARGDRVDRAGKAGSEAASATARQAKAARVTRGAAHAAGKPAARNTVTESSAAERAAATESTAVTTGAAAPPAPAPAAEGATRPPHTSAQLVDANTHAALSTPAVRDGLPALWPILLVGGTIIAVVVLVLLVGGARGAPDRLT